MVGQPGIDDRPNEFIKLGLDSPQEWTTTPRWRGIATEGGRRRGPPLSITRRRPAAMTSVRASRVQKRQLGATRAPADPTFSQPCIEDHAVESLRDTLGRVLRN